MYPIDLIAIQRFDTFLYHSYQLLSLPGRLTCTDVLPKWRVAHSVKVPIL